MSNTDHIQAHSFSSYHREQLLLSEICGCFYCLEIYSPTQITDWTDEQESVGMTALCPKCGIDSVIGSNAGFPITREFLQKMHIHWF
jgi:hypothetical protein